MYPLYPFNTSHDVGKWSFEKQLDYRSNIDVIAKDVITYNLKHVYDKSELFFEYRCVQRDGSFYIVYSNSS